METNSFIITLTGSSGCGKSYITDKIIQLGKTLEKENIHFKPIRHWKYVTRPYRDSEIIAKLNNKEIDVKSVKTIPNNCEFIYQTYGDEYSFRKQDIENLLNEGKSPIIVINDVRVIEEMKREFPNQVLSLFLFREIIPDEKTHILTNKKRGGVSSEKIKLRFERAVVLYRIYIENIFLFDKTILNIPKEKTNIEVDIAEIQVERIIRGVINKKISLNKKITKTPKLFIVSGNAQSGKDDIIRAAKKLGQLQTDILLKYTSRWAEDGDDGEIECKFIPNKKLLKNYQYDYEKDLENIENCYTLENYKNLNKELKKEYIERKKDFKDIEEFYKVKFEIEKLSKKNKLKTGQERFWHDLQKTIEESQKTLKENQNKKELLEVDYKNILKKYFEPNPKYIDLEKIAKENKELYLSEIQKIDQRIKTRRENNSGCLFYKDKNFVLYENNKKLYGKPLYYGYEIDKYVEQLQNKSNHIVLSASLPNMFRICREKFGNENVITAFAYSQISVQEHLQNSVGVTGSAKLQEYDDILRYAHHIDDFDYALIFAETSAVNKSGSQKDELVDQMFRLFRVYNKEQLNNKHKLFVLSGPSASGKSTVLSRVIKEGLCKQAPKYSNREKRKTIKGTLDDIISVSQNCIKEFCDEINYEMYGNLYGFNIDKIKKDLNKNNLITICSDINSIKKLKNKFNESFSAVFIYLQDISIENLVKAFFERKGLDVDKELYFFAINLSKSLKTENKKQIQEDSKVFLTKIKEILSDIDSLELIKRYNSLIDSKEYFSQNKELFNHSVSGTTIDELLKQSLNIIKNH